MGQDSQNDRSLLEKYAPVIRFAGGENFLPMNVEDFVAGETRMYRKPNGAKTFKAVKEWDEERDPKKRLAMLGKEEGGDVYLRYIHLDRVSTIIRFVLTIQIALLCILAGYGIFGLTSLYEFVGLDYADGFKLGFLALLIAAWPFVDADGKSHFGILLALFGIFFFGTAFTIGFAALALGQLAGFWMVYLVFSRWHKSFTRFSRRWGFPLLHGLSLFLIGMSNVAIGYGLTWLAHVYNLHIGQAYEVSAVLAVSTMLFYSLVLISSALREMHPPENLRPQEIATALILMVSLAAGLMLVWVGNNTAWLSEVGMYLAVIFLFGAVILWYLLDPLQVTGPGPLYENNDRQAAFNWDRRVLVVSSIALIVYLFLSGIVFRHDFNDINDYLFANIIHYFASAGIILVILGLLGDSIPGYFLDVLSGLYDTDTLRARKRYRDAVSSRGRRGEADSRHRYWYYGRVIRQREWVILQYNYFFAFNDFRTTAGGMNNHEGDWECVNIYLRGDIDSHSHPDSGDVHLQPFGVAYSQHHDGLFEFWEDVPRARVPDAASQNTLSSHPIVYAALGSHAMFSRPEIYPLSLQFPGTTQRLMSQLERFIQKFRTRSRLVETHIREIDQAIDEYRKERGRSIVAQGGKTDGGSREYAGGDGIRVGYGYNPDPHSKVHSDEFKAVLNPPVTVARRESNFDGVAADKSKDIYEDWSFEVITDDTPWVKYKGMWGRRSRVAGESGPQGPRWAGDMIRIRWGEADKSLEWMDTLLLGILRDDTKPASLRKRALQHLSRSDSLFPEESFGAE